jgi:hypothetical protein
VLVSPYIYSKERTPGQASQNRTARSGQPERDIQYRGSSKDPFCWYSETDQEKLAAL